MTQAATVCDGRRLQPYVMPSRLGGVHRELLVELLVLLLGVLRLERGGAPLGGLCSVGQLQHALVVPLLQRRPLRRRLAAPVSVCDEGCHRM